MEQGIATSEGNNKRTYVLLALNIVGVIGCVCNMIMLTLWAFGLEDLFLRRSADPLSNSAADYSNIMRNVFNLSILTITVSLVIIFLFAVFTKIY